RIPLWLKLGWTAWLAVWLPLYWRHYGPQNFLWFCDIANLAVGLALWLESPLLFSMQALSVLAVQVLYTVDLAGRAVSGRHLLGGTEYMFDPAVPLAVRLASLFHVATPPLLLWALRRLGYHRRALHIQIAFGWAVLAVSFFAFGPEKDLNWVWGPYERPQAWVSPWLWFAACLAGFPLLLWWPTHLALSRWAGRAPVPRPAA
ncbi:MAG TPA: hypothetical protein VIV59_03440, partial [Anaeromyxobacteraceae bacterium]